MPVLKWSPGTSPAPSAPTLAVVGTGASTTYGYKVAAVVNGSDSTLSAQASIATGPATLGSANYIRVTAPALPAGATGWRVIRTVGGPSQNVDLSGVLPEATTTFNDQGGSGIAFVPKPAKLPAVGVVRLHGREVDAPADSPFYVESGDVATVTAALQAISGTVSIPKGYQ